jgi:uncharacterized protein (DUF2141 family)
MRIITTLTAAALLGLSAIAAAQTAAPTADLTLSYAGVTDHRGAVMVALFDSEAAYNGGAPVRVAMITADADAVSTLIAGLAPGRYAIKSFHDLDGNHEMSVNPFGIPTEPFAFSNNAVGNMGPASWADAAFDVAPGAVTHSITFR